MNTLLHTNSCQGVLSRRSLPEKGVVTFAALRAPQSPDAGPAGAVAAFLPSRIPPFSLYFGCVHETGTPSSLLFAMQRIVRGVYAQDHLLRGLRMRFHRHLQQERVHPRRVGNDLLVRSLRPLQRGPLQLVQGALARQRLPSIRLQAPELPRQVVPVAQQRQEPVRAQLVVVVEILIAQA